eukprot:TRINITY_DN8817_c0_g1_i1.p1 TRINITY_DN8817_c0_g1~~TRINITY_DN8817_c0_g1_i1.p1  ORF type:complete len:236 (+),score=8.46 TRINITY_DN8817_c0_g1_i1:48-755(+)
MFYALDWAAIKSGRQSPSKMNQSQESPRKSKTCCTKIQLLETFLFISIISHILVLSIGCSILLNPEREYIEFGGYEFYSSQTGPDLATVGILGTMFSLLSLLGVWRRQRGFLIPLIFYLCVFLLVDLVSFVAYFFHYTWDSDDLFEDLENLEVIKVGHNGVNMIPADEPDISSLMVGLLIKIFANIIFLKVLVSVYRKDIHMRTTRSPLRNPGKSTSVQVEEKTPTKPGKYVQIV